MEGRSNKKPVCYLSLLLEIKGEALPVVSVNDVDETLRHP